MLNDPRESRAYIKKYGRGTCIGCKGIIRRSSPSTTINGKVVMACNECCHKVYFAMHGLRTLLYIIEHTPMFAITLIHRSGGSATAIGKTIEECREYANKKNPGSYIACTIPYAVSGKPIDVTVPVEIKKFLGVELRLMLEESDG